MTFPVAAAPVAATWTRDAPSEAIDVRPEDIPAGDGVWVARIASSSFASSAAAPAQPGMPGASPVAAADRPADPVPLLPTIEVSDRGWIGEPGDARENTSFPPRLSGAPQIEMGIPIYPEVARRSIFSAGEIALLNGDGQYDGLAGNWLIGGRPVEILRAPHRRPIHAPTGAFMVVARLRVAGAASGTTRLVIPLSDAAADLSVPLCETYGGTGGADGVASLKGQNKPRLYGIKRQIEPVLEDPARLIYRIHHGGPISAVLAVRDRGAPFSFAGDVATYADLQAASPAPGTYMTCLADGSIRVSAAASTSGVRLLTVDARGDAGGAGYSAGTGASIARKLLLGPGGLSSSAIAADAFLSWPTGEAGLYLLGGTVGEAMDAIAGGLACWWGADRLGRFTGALLTAPETNPPFWEIQPWMLRAPPEEAMLGERPRWRARVGYRVLGRVFSGEDFAGSVSDADREIWGKAYQTATSVDLGVQSLYPFSLDPPVLASALDGQGDAEALALHLRTLHAVPRRTWRVMLNRAGVALYPGGIVRLTWPRHGLASGRNLIVRSLSLRGDRAEALLWG